MSGINGHKRSKSFAKHGAYAEARRRNDWVARAHSKPRQSKAALQAELAKAAKNTAELASEAATISQCAS